MATETRRLGEADAAPALLAAGHRVITYYRRGFVRSSKPGIGYAVRSADLDALRRAP